MSESKSCLSLKSSMELNLPVSVSAVVSKLVDKGYQPHLEDFLLRLNFNNYYKDS